MARLMADLRPFKAPTPSPSTEATGTWNTVLTIGCSREVFRVHSSGGRFIFLGECSRTAWGKVAIKSLAAARKSASRLVFEEAWRMLRYGFVA